MAMARWMTFSYLLTLYHPPTWDDSEAGHFTRLCSGLGPGAAKSAVPASHDPHRDARGLPDPGVEASVAV
ncbi:hypothetical protein AV521_36920 [Streptomyces sp. IMTB 2501]|nr:hypothetical protein AV521_36920 [Streptomyces sp. IMTB 2501]